MPDFHSSPLLAVCLGIALSASAGFRVFIPLLAAAIAGHYGVYTLPEGMQWMSSWGSIICFGVAAVVEVFAYYIPFIDNALDFIGAPVAVASGTLLASSIFPVFHSDPSMRWILSLIAGGGAAGTLHLGNGLLRLLSSKLSLGTGNAVVSTTENAAAVGASTASFFIPIIMAIVVAILLVLSITFVAKRLFKQSKPVAIE